MPIDRKPNLVGGLVTSCSFTCFFCLVCDSNVVSIRERPSGNAFFDKMMKKKTTPTKNTHWKQPSATKNLFLFEQGGKRKDYTSWSARTSLVNKLCDIISRYLFESCEPSSHHHA